MGQPLLCPGQTSPCPAPKERAPPGPGQALAAPGCGSPCNSSQRNSLLSWPPGPRTHLSAWPPHPGTSLGVVSNIPGPPSARPNVHLSLVSPANPLAMVGGGTSKETEGSKSGEHGTERRRSLDEAGRAGARTWEGWRVFMGTTCTFRKRGRVLGTSKGDGPLVLGKGLHHESVPMAGCRECGPRES